MVSGIDGAIDLVTENAEIIFTRQRPSGQQALGRPHASGGKDWESVYGSAEIPMDPIFIG